MRSVSGWPRRKTGAPGAATKTRSPSRSKKRRAGADEEALRRCRTGRRTPSVGPPLAPSNTALAELLALLRSCQPPSRVRNTSPAPAAGADRTAIRTARHARRQEGSARILMKEVPSYRLRPRPVRATEGRMRPWPKVSSRPVAPRSSAVDSIAAWIAAGIGDPLAVEQRGQRGHVRAGLARPDHEEVREVVVAAGLGRGVGVEGLLEDPVRPAVGARSGPVSSRSMSPPGATTSSAEPKFE